MFQAKIIGRSNKKMPCHRITFFGLPLQIFFQERKLFDFVKIGPSWTRNKWHQLVGQIIEQKKINYSLAFAKIVGI